MFFTAVTSMASYIIIKKLDCAKSVSNVTDKVFIVFVAILLFVPVSKINLGDRVIEENRMLKPFPIFNGLKSFHENYLRNIEEWFNDRFNQRDRLIKYAYSIDAKINREQVTDKAFMAKDNWIFTKERNSIGNFQNTTYFEVDELAKIKNNIISREQWLKKQNIKFYMMIAPDKNRIYGEYYPDKIKKIGAKSQIDQIYDYIKVETNVPIIYPVEEMLINKDKGLLYYKEDTHWNNYGAYFGYRAIMDLLKVDFPSLKSVSEDELIFEKKESIVTTDLLRMLNIKESDYEKPVYIFPKLRESSAEYIGPVNLKGTITSSVNNTEKMKVIIFCDSFTEAMKPYLAESFGTVYYIADHHKFNDYQEFIMQEKPDIVIHEVVGKYVGDLLQDKPELMEVN